jgi:hypothetical protein
MRILAGQDPSDRALMALVGELATRSNARTDDAARASR